MRLGVGAVGTAAVAVAAIVGSRRGHGSRTGMRGGRETGGMPVIAAQQAAQAQSLPHALLGTGRRIGVGR